eukprot:COSAG04_NODE_15663_length_524_cov_1.138824_1_plen_50_part_10
MAVAWVRTALDAEPVAVRRKLPRREQRQLLRVRPARRRTRQRPEVQGRRH